MCAGSFLTYCGDSSDDFVLGESKSNTKMAVYQAEEVSDPPVHVSQSIGQKTEDDYCANSEGQQDDPNGSS